VAGSAQCAENGANGNQENSQARRSVKFAKLGEGLFGLANLGVRATLDL
jgi:hypothetical protein